MTNEELEVILSKPTTSIEKASEALGYGRNNGYKAVRAGIMPTIKLDPEGKRRVVPTAWIRRQLHLDERVSAPHTAKAEREVQLDLEEAIANAGRA